MLSAGDHELPRAVTLDPIPSHAQKDRPMALTSNSIGRSHFRLTRELLQNSPAHSPRLLQVCAYGACVHDATYGAEGGFSAQASERLESTNIC